MDDGQNNNDGKQQGIGKGDEESAYIHSEWTALRMALKLDARAPNINQVDLVMIDRCTELGGVTVPSRSTVYWPEKVPHSYVASDDDLQPSRRCYATPEGLETPPQYPGERLA